MTGFFASSRARAATIAGAVSIVVFAVAAVVFLVSGHGEELRGQDSECESIDIGDYNSVLTTWFDGVPVEPFGDSGGNEYDEDTTASYCFTSPDPDHYCTGGGGCEVTAEYHAAIVQRVSIRISYGEHHYDVEKNLGKTSDSTASIESWDLAVPGITSVDMTPIWADIETLTGTVVSVFEYENLQVVIDSDILMEDRADISGEGVERLVSVHQEIADGIRERAVERGD